MIPSSIARRTAPALAALAAASLLAPCPAAHALDFLGRPLPAWALAPPPGAIALTETSAVGQWQEDLQPGMREPDGRPSFPGMTWVIRADHTAALYGSCRNGKPYYHLDGRWRLDEHRFLQLEAVRADGARQPLGTMPAWTIAGQLALAPNHPGERSALDRYDGPLPPVCLR